MWNSLCFCVKIHNILNYYNNTEMTIYPFTGVSYLFQGLKLEFWKVISNSFNNV